MPTHKHKVHKKSHVTRQIKVNSQKKIEPLQPAIPNFHHKFLIDEGSGNNSPLYYILIFFTFFLILAAIYAGVDSYQKLSVGRIDSFEKCLKHPRSIVDESNPRLCTSLDRRTFFKQVVNQKVDIEKIETVEDSTEEYELTLPESWKIKKVGYDSQDKPTVWFSPIDPDYSENFRFPHEVVIGGEGVLFVEGEICASTTCEPYSDDSILFNDTKYPVKIFTDKSASPDIPRHTFQFEVKDKFEGFFVSANYYNLDQYTNIQYLLETVKVDEINELFDNIYMGFEDL